MNRNLDRGAAGNAINEVLDKVDVHLQVEMNILDRWNKKDENKAKNLAPNGEGNSSA